MKQFIKALLASGKKFTNIMTVLAHGSFSPTKYRILTIEQDHNDDYLATIQVINKKDIFKIKPEEILGDDRLTDSFSPRDIRTLTYLGYLGINSPKYKILAQRLSENDQKLLFAIREKGQRKPIIKTANEISADDEFLKAMDQKDAHLIGFTAASEQSLQEKAIKEKLLKKITKDADAKKLKKQPKA